MEIILDALPDQDAAPYSRVIDQRYKCESCNETLMFEESFRLLDDWVLFYSEPYFTCKCKGFIWLSFLESNSKYVSNPTETSTLMNPNLHSKAYVIKVSRKDIRFLKEDLKANNIQPREDYHSLYKSVITLSMQIQLAFILQPEQYFRIDFYEQEKTGLLNIVNNIIRYSGNLFWWDVKRLILLESVRLICNLVDKRTKGSFNLTRLKKKHHQICSLKELCDEFEEDPEGKYYKIRVFRNKVLSHTQSQYKPDNSINQELLHECSEDIIEAVNDLSEAIGLTFKIGYLRLYTRTERLDSLLSVLAKIDDALYNDDWA